MNPIFTHLVLLAAPVAPVAPAASVSDMLTPLYVLVGGLVATQVVKAGFSFVKWLGARTVANEDKDKADIRKQVEELKVDIRKQLEEHDERFEELDRTVSTVDRSINTVQLEMKQVLSTVEATRGMVVEIKGSMDNRFEKQSEFYRGQIKELLVGVDKRLENLEYTLRQDMSRAIHDASMMNKAARAKKS